MTSSPANSVMIFTPMNDCRENGERPGQEGGRSDAANAPSPHSDSPLPQGWTDTEATAAWGAGQQVSGWSPCSQGLDDVEAKALPRPQGRASEAPGKVTGSQPVKRWDRSKYPRELSGKGGQAQ